MCETPTGKENIHIFFDNYKIWINVVVDNVPLLSRKGCGIDEGQSPVAKFNLLYNAGKCL